MNEAILLILLILLGIPALVAFLTVVTFLLPGRINKIRNILTVRPGRAFIVGLVNLLFFGVISIGLSEAGELAGLIAFLIWLLLTGLAIWGLAGWLARLRERLYPIQKESVLSPLQMTLRSAALLLLAFLAPLVGWFILAPLLLISGLGAAIISFFRRQAPE